jgi:hypothetical protein
MSNQDFTTSFYVEAAPANVFQTISDVRQWWSGLFGEEIQDESDESFTFKAGDGIHYSRQKLIESMPERKLTWLVTDSELGFVKEPGEWTGTRIGFELIPEGSGTSVTFTHSGLTPALECFDQCSSAWSRYLNERLLPLFNQGTLVAKAASTLDRA